MQSSPSADADKASRSGPSAALLAQLEQALARCRADAEAAREDKTRFLTSINHEFRTPLNGVVAAAELLSRQSLSADAATLVDVIKDSARCLQRLVEDALDLGRGADAEMTVQPEPVTPAVLLDETAARWNSRAADQGTLLAAAFDGDPTIAILTDPMRLRQVLDAFADNALERQRQGGLVELGVRVRRSRSGVMLQVTARDGGQPVAPDTLAHMFEPFAGEDGRGFGGGGLRLTLARRAATALHGAVWAEGGAGEGLLLGFDVCVPEAEAPAAATSPTLAREARRPRVLIVDDNATNRLVAAAFCEGAGCLCETAEDGAQAVEAVRARPFDVVLMDIKMPVLDGVGATRAIRGLPAPACDVPIVALTANVDPDLARNYRAAGMCDVVDKPIKPEKLFAALESAIGEPGEAARTCAA